MLRYQHSQWVDKTNRHRKKDKSIYSIYKHVMKPPKAFSPLWLKVIYMYTQNHKNKFKKISTRLSPTIKINHVYQYIALFKTSS